MKNKLEHMAKLEMLIQDPQNKCSIGNQQHIKAHPDGIYYFEPGPLQLLRSNRIIQELGNEIEALAQLPNCKEE
eukprot:10377933-Karenia_brevis.AAC.1